MIVPLLLAQTALVGGTVHTMAPGEEPRAATVVVEGGRVAALLPPDAAPPEGAEVVDVSGMHVVPGLLDGLAYFVRGQDALHVAQGVTFLRDFALEPFRAVRERDPERRDRVPGPALQTSGATIDGDPPRSMEAVVLREPADAEASLAILLDEEVDFLSVREGLPLDVLRRVAEIAHERGLGVWGARPNEATLAVALEVGLDGVTLVDSVLPPGVDWSFVQPAALEPAIEALATRGTPVLPVLAARSVRLTLQDPDAFALDLLHPALENWWRDELALRARKQDDAALRIAERVVAKQRALVKALFDAGVPLVPGSGAPQPWHFPGLALHRELELWQACGIPAADVLRLATAGAARALGVADERGTIEPGKVADLVVVAHDPSEDVARLRDPAFVVVRGRVLPRSELDAMTAALRGELDALRAEVAKPLEVPPPDAPEGSPVLAGLVHTSVLGRVVRAERYVVVREHDGALAFAGRSRHAVSGDGGPSDLRVLQRLRDGKLVSFEVAMRRGDDELVARGREVAGMWRIERDVNGLALPLETTQKAITTLDVPSITSYLVLAQTVDAEPFAVVALHEGLEPELAIWQMRWGRTPEGLQHQVRTHLGGSSFYTTDAGSIEVARMIVGNGQLEIVLVEEDTFGGPGLPLPREKLEAPLVVPGEDGAEADAASPPAEDGAPPPAEGDGPKDDGGGAAGG